MFFGEQAVVFTILLIFLNKKTSSFKPADDIAHVYQVAKIKYLTKINLQCIKYTQVHFLKSLNLNKNKYENNVQEGR